MDSVNLKYLMVLVLVSISISGCRSIWQKPDEVIEAIALNDNDIIADIGAGRGYFAAQVISELAQAGYKLTDEHDFLPVQNILIFGSEN